MAIRIKSKWHHSARNRPTAKSVSEHAGALAFIAWRLALEHAITLHKEGFEYDSDRERIGVISEFCAFEVHVVDRLVFDRLQYEERELLITTLGQRLADQMQDNLAELAGPGEYRAPFIALLDDRCESYARLSFEDGNPGFDFVRFFARSVLDVMGETQTNRWVLDQIMDIAAPEVVEKLAPSVERLLEG
ncbi:MAG: hypothetical protein ACR2RL_17155 [Gammaproteobacteria bacterium]